MSADISPIELAVEIEPLEEAQPVKDEAVSRQVLESKAIKGTLWTVLDYGGSVGLRMVSSLILTRLLMPEVFGMMTLVTTFVVGISLLSDIGLGPSVIQNARGDEPDFLNTVWTLQAVRGIGIFFLTLILAWPIAMLYHEPRLWKLIIALSFTIVVNGFQSTNLLSLSRHLGVRRQFLLDFSTQAMALCCTIALVLLWQRSVWAIVWGTTISAIYKMCMSYYKRLVPGIGNRFRWNKEHVHSVIHFGKWILLSTAFFFFASQADRLILGKLISLSMLGVYGIAYSISDIPRAVINAFSQRVGFPFIAKMAHLPIAEFRRVFLRYRFKVLLLGASLLTLMVHLGGVLVTIMYDRRYHAASWIVPILALGLWHTLMYSTTMTSLLSLGRSHYSALGNSLYFLTTMTAIPIAFHFFGLFGAVIAVAAGDLPLYFVTVTGSSREGVSTWRQDVLMTGVFALFLGVGLAIRKAMGA